MARKLTTPSSCSFYSVHLNKSVAFEKKLVKFAENIHKKKSKMMSFDVTTLFLNVAPETTLNFVCRKKLSWILLGYAWRQCVLVRRSLISSIVWCNYEQSAITSTCKHFYGGLWNWAIHSPQGSALTVVKRFRRCLFCLPEQLRL